MKTVVIWDRCGDSPIEFYTCEGDLGHLQGIYINSSDVSDEIGEELQSAIDAGTRSEEFPIEEVMDEKVGDVKVIVAGFIP